jgi:hypothetical protein
VFALTAVLARTAHGQSNSDVEYVVKREIETGFFDGHDQKSLVTQGDAGAVLATKILAGNKLTPNMIKATLGVLSQSFSDMALVENQNDRQPRTALLLLRYFDSSTSDPALKVSINTTAKYINEHYAASLSSKQK